MRVLFSVRSWTFILVMVVATMLLAACGDDPEPTPTASQNEITTPTTSQPAAEAPSAAVGDPTAVSESPLPAAGAPVTTTLSPTETVAAVAAADASATEEGSSGCVIEPNPDLVGYDDVIGRLGCPISEGSNDTVGINEFGEGPDYNRFMLWFGAEGQIYVLTSDGRWLAYTDTWEEGEPEILCNPEELDPATSPPLPRRGFGKLWCTVDTVRTAMGHIDREERLCQHAVVQRFQQGRLLACFEDATIRYFRILENGSWDMERVQ